MASQNSTKKFEFKGFKNLTFTAEERQAFTEWTSMMEDSFSDCLQVLVEAGYKISFKYDDYHQVLQTAMTCTDLGSAYCGWCFTLKHREPERVLQIFRYLYDSQLKDENYVIEEAGGEYDW